MRKIKLTHDKYAIVDDGDYHRLNQHKWHLSSKGYAVRSITLTKGVRGKEYIHRIVIDVAENQAVDHTNNDRLDNRKSNLRIATQQQNTWNRSKMAKPTSSRFKGVCWRDHARKWQANIRINNRQVHLGYFAEESQAAKAYADKALELFGEFAGGFSVKQIKI